MNGETYLTRSELKLLSLLRSGIHQRDDLIRELYGRGNKDSLEARLKMLVCRLRKKNCVEVRSIQSGYTLAQPETSRVA